MADDTETVEPTDAELILAAEDSLQALHALIDDAGDPATKAALATHHTALQACLDRYNRDYAGENAVALRSGGNKPPEDPPAP